MLSSSIYYGPWDHFKGRMEEDFKQKGLSQLLTQKKEAHRPTSHFWHCKSISSLCVSCWQPHLKGRCTCVHAHTWGRKVDTHSEAVTGPSSLVHVSQFCIFGPFKFFHTWAHIGDVENRSGSVKWPFEVHCNFFFSCETVHFLSWVFAGWLFEKSPITVTKSKHSIFVPSKYNLLVTLPQFLRVYIVVHWSLVAIKNATNQSDSHPSSLSHTQDLSLQVMPKYIMSNSSGTSLYVRGNYIM